MSAVAWVGWLQMRVSTISSKEFMGGRHEFLGQRTEDAPCPVAVFTLVFELHADSIDHPVGQQAEEVVGIGVLAGLVVDGAEKEVCLELVIRAR